MVISTDQQMLQKVMQTIIKGVITIKDFIFIKYAEWTENLRNEAFNCIGNKTDLVPRTVHNPPKRYFTQSHDQNMYHTLRWF